MTRVGGGLHRHNVRVRSAFRQDSIVTRDVAPLGDLSDGMVLPHWFSFVPFSAVSPGGGAGEPVPIASPGLKYGFLDSGEMKNGLSRLPLWQTCLIWMILVMTTYNKIVLYKKLT